MKKLTIITLLKIREQIERLIRKLDKEALLHYELKQLSKL